VRAGICGVRIIGVQGRGRGLDVVEGAIRERWRVVAVVVFVQRIVLQCIFWMLLGGQTRGTELYGIGIVALWVYFQRAHRGT